MSLKRVFVYGGKGALGAECVSKFKSLNWVSTIIVVTIKQIVYTFSSCDFKK